MNRIAMAKELMAVAKLVATGEMSRSDIQPGGEHYEWAESLRKAAIQLQRMTLNMVRFKEVRPFDVYQGPYVNLAFVGGFWAKLWSSEEDGEFYLEFPNKDIVGTIPQIALEVRKYVKELQLKKII